MESRKMHVSRRRCRLQQLLTQRCLCVLGRLVTKRQAPAADTCFPYIQHCLEAFVALKLRPGRLSRERQPSEWVIYETPTLGKGHVGTWFEAKDVRLCFPPLIPSSSVSGPQSLLEPLHL